MYYSLVLKKFFETNYGNNYPIEIVYFIIGFMFRPIKISAGLKHSIITGNKTFVWGSNKHGQLGLGDFKEQCTPHELKFKFDSEIETVCCGGNYSFAVTTNGKAYGWGKNLSGQLGLGDYIDRSSPQELVLLNIIDIRCGKDHTMALTKYNKVYSFGDNSCGQLGLEDMITTIVPKKIILENAISIICGRRFSGTITKNHEIYM